MPGPITARQLRRSLIAAAALQVVCGTAAALTGGATYSWNTGYLSDQTFIPTLYGADTLNIGAGNYKYVNTGLTNNGTVNWQDTLYFSGGNTITNTSTGTWTATGSAAFIDNGYGGNFNNSGLFDAGVSTVTINGGIGFVNSGTVHASAGGLVNFNSGNTTFNAGTQFTGAGVVSVGSNATFNGAFSSQNLQLAAGSYNGNAAQINGTVAWVTGSLTGSWSLASGQTLNLQTGNYHYLSGSLANAGTLTAQDVLYFSGGNTLTNTGTYNLQGDIGFADAGYGGNFINNGTLNKTAGSGSSTVSGGIAFVNNGTVNATSGAIVFNSSNATFNAGSQFTGAGQVQVNSNAAFNGAFTSANLQLISGTYTGSAAQVNGTVDWFTGYMTGSWQVNAGQLLRLQPGNYHYLSSGSLVNNGTLAVQDTLYLSGGSTLTNNSLYDLQADAGFADGGYSGTFVNNGTLRKSMGTGDSTVNGITFVNNGVINAQTGRIVFAGGSLRFNDGTQFTGAGQVAVTSDATFVGTFTTAGNLTLSNGNFTGGDGTAGSKAVMNGNMAWTTGTLAGSWQLAAGRTLTLQTGNYHYVNGTLVNNGTLAAQDMLYLQSGNTLTNNSLYDMQADVGLGDGGYSGTFTNNGTLRKSVGTGDSTVNGITFINNGVINAQTGRIVFASGSLLFNDGTQFTGAGQVAVTGNATFVGAFTTASNLTLGNGSTFTGGDGTAGSKAVMNGNTAWSTGTLTGNWQVAAGNTLTLQTGNYHSLSSGTLVNNGTLAAQDTLYLSGGSTLTNNGTYNMQGDMGVLDGGYNGHFINTGLVVKSAGTGTSDLTQIDFVNAAGGTVDVRSGTIALPQNFTNSGTLKGAGTYSLSGTLTNAGHVAPGESLGTLSIAGSFAQTAAGSFDVDLGGAAGADELLVSGTAALNGKLALSCVGNCSYAVGSTLTILGSTGALSGTFAGGVTLNGFATGAFTVEYDTTNDRVVLLVTQAVTAAVPEPGSWGLMLGGLAAVGGLARRRRMG